MKYIMVRINANRNRGGNRFLYPKGWNSEEVVRNITGPLLYDGAIARGGPIEILIMLMEDDLADRLQAADPSSYTILPNDNAVNALLANNPLIKARPEEAPTNPAKIALVTAKMAAIAQGVEYSPGNPVVLTDDDIAALDPDNPISGNNRRAKTAPDIFTQV